MFLPEYEDNGPVPFGGELDLRDLSGKSVIVTGGEFTY